MENFAALILVMLLAQSAFALDSKDGFRPIQRSFCWRNTYDQPTVVKEATQCRPDYRETKAEEGCYRPCAAGLARDFYQYQNYCTHNCPKEWTKTIVFGQFKSTLFCKLKQTGKSYEQMSACQKENGQGKCFQSQNLFYSVKPADCPSIKMQKNDAFSCKQEIFPSYPLQTFICGPGLDYNNGLCYKQCKQGYIRFGKTCWQKAPQLWVECGFGIAKTDEDCVKVSQDDDILNLGQAIFKSLNLLSKPGESRLLALQLSVPFTDIYGLIDESNRLRDLIIKNLSDKQVTGLIQKANYQINTEIFNGLNNKTFVHRDIVSAIEQMALIINPGGRYNKLKSSHPQCKL